MRLLLALAFTVLSLSGCSLAHLQAGMDRLDAAYRAENDQLIAALGTKYYKLEKPQAMTAMLLALTNLGATIDTQDQVTGFVAARARTPNPLSESEFNAVAQAELPRAREITGLPVEFSKGRNDIVINVFLLPRANDLQVNVRFQMRSLHEVPGLVLGTQPPPAAVRIALPKLWNEFEKVAFVQGRVLYGDAPAK